MKTRKFARFCSISPLPPGADEPEGVPPLPFHKTPQDAAHRVPSNAGGMGSLSREKGTRTWQTDEQKKWICQRPENGDSTDASLRT